MRNGNDTDRKERNIDTTLNALSARKEAPKIWFFVLLIIYIFTSVVINRLAHSNNIRDILVGACGNGSFIISWKSEYNLIGCSLS